MQTALHVSRRALLSGAAATLALPFVPRPARALAPPVVSEAAWRELGRHITGGVVRPNDPRFVDLTQPENLHYYNPPDDPGGTPDPNAPFGVVRPLTPSEVAYAIKWSRDNNLPMVPRSGGHSYAGCSTIAGLVINSSRMRSVKVEDGLVEAAGGAVFGDLLATLRDVEGGRYTITHGRCRGVGLSAYLMGGGWALDSAFLGMGCDRVKKVEMVLADGRVVRASEDGEHRDLFWAVRGGGGGNLGFATRWWLDPVPVQNVVAFSGNWRLSSGGARTVFHTLLSALDVAPDRMGAELTMSATHGASSTPWPYAIALRCQFHGSRDEFNSILGAALAAADRVESSDCKFDDCSSKDLSELPYWDAQEFFDVGGYPNRYRETSLFAAKVSSDFIDEIFDIWPGRPATTPAARLTAYRVGGKVNAVAPEATAFVHRTYKWIITTDIDWSDAHDKHLQDYLDWQRGVHDKFYEMLDRPGSYQNFPDPGLADHTKAYWGANFPRLSQIKGRYDPDFVFTPPRNQGISPGPQATRTVPTAQPSGQTTSP